MPLAITQSVSCTATPSTLAVEAQGISRIIDGHTILHDLSFSIPRGSFVSLIGANGAGKSTLLKILAMLTPPTEGQLSLFGRSMSQNIVHTKSMIGFVTHSPMLYRDLSALENLIFFGRLYAVPDPLARAQELLDYVGLKTRAHDLVKTFSRGMTQRVAIARALMHEPDLVLADEPFAGLDAPSTRTIEQILQSLHESGKTIILANHNIQQSMALAQRTIALRQGKLVFDETTDAHSSAERLLEVIGQ